MGIPLSTLWTRIPGAPWPSPKETRLQGRGLAYM